MKKELVVICDSEPLYAKRLYDYIEQKINSDFDIRTFSSVSLLISTLQGCLIDFLIVDIKYYLELLRQNYKKFITVSKLQVLSGDDISELSFDERAGLKDEDIVKKYQSAAKICGFLGKKIVGTLPSENKTCDLKHLKNTVKSIVQSRMMETGEASDNEILKVIDEIIENEGYFIDDRERFALRNSVFYSIRGLDVLEELLSDESVTEIMVNGENHIFCEKHGRIENTGKCFDSREQLKDIIQKIVSDANRTVNMSSPIVDARLSNGSRVNVVLDPVSMGGPILTIRRFPSDPLTADRLITMGAVSEEVILLLRKLVQSGYNILISGGTGSGKTTFLNILSGYIPKDERIITIEDSAELKIMGIDNLVRLETRNANTDGCDEITIRDLIKSALRMRPDRIIVGEVRGAEAIDMMQAFTVGQDGSMSTIHSNSAEDALYRLEMLMMLAGIEMPLGAIRRQISIGVDIIIQLGRLKDKSRKVLEIREVTGFENDIIGTSLLYKYEKGEFIKYNDLKNTYKMEKAFNV